MSLRNLIFTVLFLGSSNLFAAPPDLVQYVNTLQGTNSTFELTRGNTYPTTALPFAMHTWTPQTGRNGDGWKYQYLRRFNPGFSASAPVQLLDERLRRFLFNAGYRQISR